MTGFFFGQEPGSEQESASFCAANGHPGDIQWNFEKFLIGRDGKLLQRYAPTTKPRDNGLIQDIADAL